MSLRDRIADLCVQRGHFVLASGRTSNVYVDVRRASLDAVALSEIGPALYAALSPFAPRAVGGPVAGAIPLVASVILASAAQDRPIPGFMVRKEAKDHGTARTIDGHLERGWSVALVEDVITSGGSVIQAIEAVRDAGARVSAVACVVDREQGGRAALAAMGVELVSLYTMREIVGEDATA
jgi:orotate phosphoribosyltransferase